MNIYWVKLYNEGIHGTMTGVDIFTIVENVPGLGASGYVEHAKDFKSVSEEKAARGMMRSKAQ